MSIDPNEIAVAAIGVIGTLLGTVLGWVLNSISQMGKLSFYVSRWEHEVKSNVRGVMMRCSTKESAEYYHYELEFDVYNSSNETRIMRDVRLSFRSNKATLFEDRPYDGSTESMDGRYSHYEVVSPINIPPNNVLAVSLFGGFWKADDARFSNIWDVDRVILAYKDEKGRDRTVNVATVDVESCLSGDEQKES
jgi:hypothetical protein